MKTEKMNLRKINWGGDVFDFTILLFFIAPWLALIPLFWTTPASAPKPEGNNGCTHWQDCREQTERIRPLAGPDKEGDKNRTASEEK